MSSSLQIGRIAGIKVQIHWTFWLLFLFIGFLVFSNEGTWTDLLWHSIFIVGLFFCVVLHEFGHALTAKRFGISTRSITLLPIGGLASLKKLPENPKEEFLVAIAGPAVNVVIAIFLALFVPVENYTGMDAEALQEQLSMITSNNIFFYLLTANIALVLFNLIPAFPMDGGRALRALLAMRMGKSVAETIRGYVDDERVAQMLDHFTQYVGSSPLASGSLVSAASSIDVSGVTVRTPSVMSRATVARCSSMSITSSDGR